MAPAGMTIPRQRTIESARSLDGVGLHTGSSVQMRLLPAEVQTGIRFRRVDLDGQPEIPATVAKLPFYKDASHK